MEVGRYELLTLRHRAAIHSPRLENAVHLGDGHLRIMHVLEDRIGEHDVECLFRSKRYRMRVRQDVGGRIV